MAILAGSTLGGGTTINWGCCIPTPDYVREEWSNRHGAHRLPQFGSGEAGKEFDEALTAVAKRIGASEDGVVHNSVNQLMLDGVSPSPPPPPLVDG
eukprot:SAG11_NODE_6199_length_1366_cov_3.453039_2_plen_95_part_01